MPSENDFLFCFLYVIIAPMKARGLVSAGLKGGRVSEGPRLDQLRL